MDMLIYYSGAPPGSRLPCPSGLGRRPGHDGCHAAAYDDRIDKITARAEQRASAFDDELIGMLEKRSVEVVGPTPAELATFQQAVAHLADALGRLTRTEQGILASLRRAIAAE